MSRSLLTDVQFSDPDVLSEAEHSEIDHTTVSGVPSSFIDLSDTPNSYEDGKFLVSTTNGIGYTSISTTTSGINNTINFIASVNSSTNTFVLSQLTFVNGVLTSSGIVGTYELPSSLSLE